MNTDRIVAFSAIFISLLTLVTFVYQTNLMKRQSELSVLPYLTVGTSYNSSESNPFFKLSLVNEGVGPAIIKSRKIIYKGDEHNGDFIDFLKLQLPSLDTMKGISFGSIEPGTVLPSGEDIYMVAIFGHSDNMNLLYNKIIELNEDDFDYEIVYKSIYDKEWRITSNTLYPDKLE